MENKITVFNPVGKDENIYDLKQVLYSIQRISKKTGINVDTTNIEREIDKRNKERNNLFDELISFIRKYWGKYVNMKFSYNTNSKEDKDENPSWFTDYELNGLLYQYIPTNDSLFGVFSVMNDNYTSFVKDMPINLMELMDTHRLEISEITEEEFLRKAEESNLKCLKNRLDKIESGDYELTENGYRRPISVFKANVCTQMSNK